MAQTATSQGDTRSLPGTQTRVANARFERIFFSALAGLILLSVFIGFAQSYFLLSVPSVPRWRAFNHPPYPFVVHLHGLLFTAWIILLITQTSLVAAHRLKLHRRLGIAGFVLACLLSLAGLAVACESMARHFPLGLGYPGIVDQSGAILSVFGFAILTYFGYRQRRNPAAHKRLMMLATISLLSAAFSRWPFLHDNTHLRAALCCFALAALIASYDLWSSAKVYTSTLCGGAILIVTNPPISVFLTHNPVWFHISLYMQIAGRHLY
jgi:hypothetical protein